MMNFLSGIRGWHIINHEGSARIPLINYGFTFLEIDYYFALLHAVYRKMVGYFSLYQEEVSWVRSLLI